MMQDFALTQNRKMRAWDKNIELVKPGLQILYVCVVSSSGNFFLIMHVIFWW